MANQMNAEERRAYMEQAIREGGSVLHGQRVISSIAELPSMGELANTEQERHVALADIEQRRQQLNDEEARVRSASGTQSTSTSGGTQQASSDEMAEDFPGRAALMEAGYSKMSDVNSLSEEELTGINGIGPATAAKIIERRDS